MSPDFEPIFYESGRLRSSPDDATQQKRGTFVGLRGGRRRAGPGNHTGARQLEIARHADQRLKLESGRCPWILRRCNHGRNIQRMGEFLKRLRREPTEPRTYVSYDDFMKLLDKVRPIT